MDRGPGPLDNTDGSDEESQISQARSVGSTASRKSDPNRVRSVPVFMNMNESTEQQFREEYGIAPILARSQPFHAHPHSAHQRNRMELEALKLIGRKALVLDVGSGARRHAHYNIHCMCPYLQPGDKERLNMAIDNGNLVCDHRLQQLGGDCVCSPRKHDYLLFVHSAYYISFPDLTEALEKTTSGVAYVVGHSFPETFGSLCFGEASYQLELSSDEPFVKMSVRGNKHGYSHPPLLWDNRTAFGYDHRVVAARERYVGIGACTDPDVVELVNRPPTILDVETVYTYGDTVLWRVRYNQALYSSPSPMPWHQALVDHSQRGPILIPGFNDVTKQGLGMNASLLVDVDKLYGWGGMLFTETVRGKIYVPRDVVESAARQIHGKTRDPALMADVIYHVRNSINRSRIPENLRLIAQTVSAALAFNINVQNEVDVTNTIVTRYSGLWKLHQSLMALTPTRAMSIPLIMAVFAVVFFLVIVLLVTVPYDHHVVGLSVFVVWFFCCCGVSVAIRAAKHQSRKTADNWSTTLATEERLSHITGQFIFPARTSFPAFSGLRQPLIPPSGQTLEVGDDLHPRKHPGTTANVMNIQGIAFNSALPVAPRTDQQSEITAITHRILRPVTKVVQRALDKFYDLEATHAGRLLLSARVEGSATMTEDWINQEKFSGAQKIKFTKVYNEQVKGVLSPPRGAFDSFVKFEKMKTMTPGGLESLKTRLINGPPDAVKVATGPWMARVYAAVRKAWDGVGSNVMYASGMAPDVIGKRLDAFAAKYGGWDEMMGIWSDCVAYDSTLENELLAIRQMLYPNMGVPEITMKWLRSPLNAIKTKHGLKASLGKKVLWNGEEVDLIRLFSGENDTNVIGTIINGLAHLSGLPSDLPFLMMICGDDNFLMLPKAFFHMDLFDALRDHLLELGLQPVMGISPKRDKWEFCSKLFWPAIDPVTNTECTVLGPKPGRWLTRIGSTLVKPSSMNFRAAMLSSMQDCAHIPLISEYVKAGVHLSHGMKASGKEYSELKHVTRSYKMSPNAINMLVERYGISIQTYDVIVHSLTLATKIPIILAFDELASMAEVDEQ